MKFDWKRKLTSRKFWLAVIGFAIAIGVTFGVDDLTMENVTGLISAMSVLVAYIIGEGFADAQHTDNKEDNKDA